MFVVQYCLVLHLQINLLKENNLHAENEHYQHEWNDDLETVPIWSARLDAEQAEVLEKEHGTREGDEIVREEGYPGVDTFVSSEASEIQTRSS